MKEYEVAIGWNGYIGVEETYNVDADSEDEAIEYAMDEAKMDLNVESTECLYDPDDEDEELNDEDFDESGEYTKPTDWEVVVSFGSFLNPVEETYTVLASDEDDAINQALEEAYFDLSVEWIECADEEDDELTEGLAVEGRGNPKTVEVAVLQGNYGYGWDDLCQYRDLTWGSDDRKEMQQDLKDYRENEPQYRHRIIYRRVPNPNYKDPNVVADEGCHGGKKKKSKKKVLNQKKVCGEDAKRTKNGVTFFIDDNAEPEVVRKGLVDYTLDGYVDMGDFDAPCKVGFYDGEDEPVYIFVDDGVTDDGYHYEKDTIALESYVYGRKPSSRKVSESKNSNLKTILVFDDDFEPSWTIFELNPNKVNAEKFAVCALGMNADNDTYQNQYYADIINDNDIDIVMSSDYDDFENDVEEITKFFDVDEVFYGKDLYKKYKEFN